MAEAFLSLSPGDRRDALGVAADQSGRPVHLLEKDVWVVWALQTLFGSPLGTRLVFKGGTSLSKAYGAINRFSEDVDLTYDIRAIASDMVGDQDDPLPQTRSEEKRWSKEIRQLLPDWVTNQAQPVLAAALTDQGLEARLRAEGEKLFIDYDPVAAGSGYVAPSVMLEFGARSTGEPAEQRAVACDAAPFVSSVIFPSAHPRVMRAERTFWEKATAMHVYCLQERLRGERFARHWHDLARLDDAAIADSALKDREIAEAVARHKTMFFPEKAMGEPIEYGRAVRGALQLVPTGDAAAALRNDYKRMVEDGLLLDDAESFDALMEHCGEIAKKANGVANEGASPVPEPDQTK